jgi:predicted amidohydrolase YtcJ
MNRRWTRSPCRWSAAGARAGSIRSLAQAGAELALSSDWGVSTLNPFAIIETAITRQPPGGGVPAFLPQERLDRWQAVLGYTRGAARALWCEDEAGSLAPGKAADLIVLDRDIFACPATEIGQTRVVLTLAAGRVVHRKTGAGQEDLGNGLRRTSAAGRNGSGTDETAAA